MSRFIVIIACFFFLFPHITFANTEVDIKSFLDEIKTYSNEIFPELESENILDDIISGGITDKVSILTNVTKIFFKELKIAISLITKILIASIFCSVLRNITPKSESSVKDVAFYVCYLVIVGLIINSYINVSEICEATIVKLTEFMNLLIPLVLSLLVANGTIVSARNDETGNTFDDDGY